MNNKPFLNAGETIVETGLSFFGLMSPKQISDALRRHEKEIIKLNNQIKTLKREVKKLKTKPSTTRKTKRRKRDDDIHDDDDYDYLD